MEGRAARNGFDSADGIRNGFVSADGIRIVDLLAIQIRGGRSRSALVVRDMPPCGAAGLSADARGFSPAGFDSRRTVAKSPGTSRYLGLRSLAPPTGIGVRLGGARLRSGAGALARSLQTLRVCLTLAPPAGFDSRSGAEKGPDPKKGTWACGFYGTPNGNRTRVAALKGRCPGPLDDGGL